MSTLRSAGARALPVVALWVLAGALGLVVLVAWRLRTAHPAPIYPDGYQYLAMARGLTEGGRPLLQLGPGGDLLAPNADAAAKPLYPGLIALAHLVGVPLADAARWISALASASLVPLTGILAHRLSGRSGPAALAAAAAVLASPSLGFWSGFPGPDSLAFALAAGAGLVLASRRAVVGGALAALACCTRPELGLIAGAALVAGLAHRPTRAPASRAGLAGLVAVGVVLAAIRPPLVVPGTSTLVAGSLALALAGGLGATALRARRVTLVVATALAPCAIVAILVVRAGGSRGWQSLIAREWPLVACALVGLIVALARPAHRLSAVLCGSAGLWLAPVYLLKNPGSERYAALLVPIAALGIGLGVGTLSPRFGRVGATAVTAIALATAVGASVPAVGRDMFPQIASAVEALPGGAVITAAPDAYGVLAPARSWRELRPGARGLILMDATARAYAPDLGVRGRLVARIPTEIGFLRPDGRIDRNPALLFDGQVVAR